MKAKVIKTGEMVDVYHEPQHGQTTNIYKECVLVNGRMWPEDELDFYVKTSEAPEQYISKSAVVAEIDRLIERAKAERVLYPKTILAAKNYLLIEDYKKLLSIIDTLEVKEVDFHKELLSYYRHTNDSGSEIALAKHFFEMGLSYSVDESVVRKVIDLYFEACKHYDEVIKQERNENGGSQFAIDILDGSKDMKELCVQYVLDKVTKEIEL